MVPGYPKLVDGELGAVHGCADCPPFLESGGRVSWGMSSCPVPVFGLLRGSVSRLVVERTKKTKPKPRPSAATLPRHHIRSTSFSDGGQYKGPGAGGGPTRGGRRRGY